MALLGSSGTGRKSILTSLALRSSASLQFTNVKTQILQRQNRALQIHLNYSFRREISMAHLSIQVRTDCGRVCHQIAIFRQVINSSAGMNCLEISAKNSDIDARNNDSIRDAWVAYWTSSRTPIRFRIWFALTLEILYFIA